MKTINELAKRTKTKYLKRTNELKSSNFRMDLTTLDAYSYDWWLFVRKVNGKVIINDCTYSATTNRHQSKAKTILDYKYDLKLRFTRKSLSSLVYSLDDEVRLAKLTIKSLIRDIKKPRTQKAKNETRKESIKELLKHIANVRSIKREA